MISLAAQKDYKKRASSPKLTKRGSSDDTCPPDGFAERNWFSDLFNSHYDTLFKYIRFLLRDFPYADSHDIIQDTFFLAWKEDIRSHPNPPAWLFVTARNLCKNHIHTNWRRVKKAGPSDTQDAASSADEVPASDIMLTLREALSLEEFWLITEYCIKGTPPEEISRTMGISVPHIRVRIQRIRKRLKGVLAFVFLLRFI